MGIKTKLNSSQVARLVDLLSEGEIEGFPSASGLTPGTTAYYLASLKDTFFNNTPVLDSTATVTSSSTKNDAAIVEKLNFDMRDARFESRLGKQDQLPLENIDDLNQSTVVVNAEVLKNGDIGTVSGGGFFDYLDGSPATPVTRQITDTDVTSVRLTIGSPAMTVSKDDGRLRGVRIDYSIEIQYQGDGYNRVDFGDYDEKNVYLGNGRFTHIGFSPDLYQRKHLINLDAAKIQAGTAFPVDIRVTSLGKEFNSDTLAQNDDLIWYDITLKVGEKTRYPNSAVVGLLFNAEQFPSLPQRSYKIRGIKVRIPHNATVQSDGRLYYDPSVAFNGTLKTTREWTNDPAFILYDLLTNTRYGLGSQILTPEERAKDAANNFNGASDVAENLDIYSFQKASAYCSELVQGEPRFSCNVLLQTQQEAFKLIEEMCSVFRAMPFWELGGITVAQDAPDVFAYTFNQSNVTQAGFSYSGASLKNRPTCVSVKYFDNNLRDFAYELVELAQTSFKPVRKYGYNKKNITAFACTSRAQARRLGLWFLYSAHNETEVCSFETDIAAGITVRPGDLIKVGDPVRAGKTVAGRVTSGSTTTSVKLDRTSSDMFGTQVPSTFTLNVITEGRNSDGTAKVDPRGARKDALIYEVEAIAGCTISGDTVTLPSDTQLNSAPVAGSAFSIGYDGLSLSLWRVLSVVENEATYAITALAHERDKYSVIDADHTFTPRDVTQLAEKPDPITNLRLQEISFEEGDKVLQRVAITWQESPRASQYEVVVRLDSDNEETHFVTTTGFDVMDSQKGVYNVSVTAIGYGLDPEQSGKRRSSPVAASIRAEGRTAIPSNIASLNITPIDQHNAELHWPEPTDLDVKIGGTIEIRHNPRTTGDIKWAQSEKIVPAVNGSTTRKIVPLLDGHYLVRAKSSNGKYAPLTGIPTVLVELPEPQDLEVVRPTPKALTSLARFRRRSTASQKAGSRLKLTVRLMTSPISRVTNITLVTWFPSATTSCQQRSWREVDGSWPT